MAVSGASPSITTSTIRPAFKTLVIFDGTVPRSCSSLPPLPFRSTSLLDSFTKTRSQVWVTVPADSLIILLFNFSQALTLLWWPFSRTSRTSLKFCRLFSTRLSSSPDLSIASVCGTRVSRDMRGVRASPIVEDSGGTSLRVHLGYLLASGPALALVLHLPMRCGSRTTGLGLRCQIVSREEGYCMSWVPLGVERVACMTAEYLETSSRNLYEVVSW